MTIKFRAKFDGKALRPSEPIDLKADVEYEVTVRERKARGRRKSPYILDRIAELATDMGVTDLAEHHDDYALGRRKLPEAPNGNKGKDAR